MVAAEEGVGWKHQDVAKKTHQRVGTEPGWGTAGVEAFHNVTWDLPSWDRQWKEGDEAGGFAPERREGMVIAGNRSC